MRATSRGGFADRPMACECNHTLVLAQCFFADGYFINEPREDDWAAQVLIVPPGAQLSVVTDGATRKRSAAPHFYPYRTRIGSHNLPLATACTEYVVYIPSIHMY